MRQCILRDNRIISVDNSPYIIAEMNTSHFGYVDKAKAMMDGAKAAGCDCVKFQSWSAESLYSKTHYDANPFAKRMVGRFAFDENKLAELACYAKEIGIGFSSTPYCEAEVDFLVERCDAPFVKIASMDSDNKKFLEYIGRAKVPVVLSTGMSNMDEVKSAVDTLLTAGTTNLALLHCISIYPAEPKTIRLNNILGLMEEFPEIPVGFSDHSLGCEMASAATALGASLIEKHLTLDKSKIGMDNEMAIEPDEMQGLVNSVRNVYEAMGTKERIVSEAELEMKAKMRRSVIAICDIKSGEVITEDMLGAKRPATGIALKDMEMCIGKKAARDIEADTVIDYSDII